MQEDLRQMIKALLNKEKIFKNNSPERFMNTITESPIKMKSIFKKGSVKNQQTKNFEEIKEKLRNLKHTQFKNLTKLKRKSINSTIPASPYQYSRKKVSFINNNESSMKSKK